MLFSYGDAGLPIDITTHIFNKTPMMTNVYTNSAATTPVWRQIEEMVQDVPGWTPIDQLFALFNLVYTTPVRGDVLEIGSWCGRSSLVLALAAKLSRGSKVYCVDLFPEKSDWSENADGSFSMSVRTSHGVRQAYDVQTVWREPFMRDIAPIYEKHNSILDRFNENIARFGLTDYVHTFRGTSEDFFKDPVSRSLRFKLAFVDADHSYEAVSNDIKLCESRLEPGSWLTFDDAFSTYEGVNKAITTHVLNSDDYSSCQQMTRKLFVARRN